MIGAFIWQLTFLATSLAWPDQPTCRLSNVRVPVDLFLSYACGECFFYTFLQNNKVYDKYYHIARCPSGVLICDSRSSDEQALASCNCLNMKNVYNVAEFSENATSLETLVMEPALPYDFLKMTKDCCYEARACCDSMLQKESLLQEELLIGGGLNSTEQENRTGPVRCPQTWDGWQCFQEAEAGQLVQGSCPSYMYGWSWISVPTQTSEYHSLKQCGEDGSWFKNNYTGMEWTDYRKCATSRMNEQVMKHLVGIVAFAVSVISVIPAIIIFSVYRSLQVDRITIHKHLLFSFLLTGVLYIFNNIFFVADDASGAPLVESNHISCIILFLIQLRYLRLANYMWMLCEGLYLYKFLFDAFSDHVSLNLYYLLGWVFPMLPTAIYACLRAYLDNDKCWVIPNIDWIEWLTFGPCILSLALNLILMIKILSILITKLRHSPTNEPAQYRKAVRATLVLLPVFGLHFFITIYRLGLVWYEIVNKLLDGLQGFVVAVIICYTHGEVLDQLKKTWRTYRMQQTCELEMRRSKRSFEVEREQSLLSTVVNNGTVI